MSYQDEYIHEYIQKLDREQSREVQNVLSQVLSVSYPENSSMHVWLEKPESWIAVPIAPGDNLTRFANVVLRLAADKSYRELLGVCLETEPYEPVAFFVQNSFDGISEFNVEPPPSYKVLFAGVPDWVILMAESDFYVIAGPTPTVEKCLDHSAEQAFADFKNYIESWEFPEQFAQRLQSLKNILWKVYRNTLEGYQNAPVGSRINLFG